MNKDKRKGGGFVQIPWNAVLQTTDAELKALAVLTHYCSMQGGGFPSIETIAREAGKHRRAIITALESLAAKGIIKKTARPGLTTVYHLPGSDRPQTTKSADDQTDESGGSSAENCTGETPPNPCRILHGSSAEFCTHNNNDLITLKQEQIHEHKRARARKPPKSQKEKESIITFAMKNPAYNPEKADEMEEAQISPFATGAIDRLYLAALKIGYRMTVDEVFKFAWAMIDRGYYSRKGVFHRVADFDSLLYAWRDAQTPEKARQAVSEQERLKAGEEIYSGEVGRSWGILRPFPELESIDPVKEHRLYKELKRAGNERSFNRERYLEAEKAFDALPEAEQARALGVIQRIKKNIDPAEIFNPQSKYYWRTYEWI